MFPVGFLCGTKYLIIFGSVSSVIVVTLRSDSRSSSASPLPAAVIHLVIYNFQEVPGSRFSSVQPPPHSERSPFRRRPLPSAEPRLHFLACESPWIRAKELYGLIIWSADTLLLTGAPQLRTSSLGGQVKSSKVLGCNLLRRNTISRDLQRGSVHAGDPFLLKQ